MLKKLILVTMAMGLFACGERLCAGNLLKSNEFSKAAGWDFYVEKASATAGSEVQFDEGKAVITCAKKVPKNPVAIQVTRKNLDLVPGTKYVVRFKAKISQAGGIHGAYRRQGEKMQPFFWTILPEKTDYEYPLTVKNLSGTQEERPGILFFFLGGLDGRTLSIWNIRIYDAAHPDSEPVETAEAPARIGDVVYSVSGDAWPGWTAKPAGCEKIVNAADNTKCVRISAAGTGESGELGNRDVFGKVAKAHATSFLMSAAVGDLMKKYRGYELEFEVDVKGKNVPAGLKTWEGVSVSANYGTDSLNYNHCYYNDFSGTFDWKNIRYRIRIPRDMNAMNLNLGLIAPSGEVFFNHLKLTITDIPFSMKEKPEGKPYRGYNLPRLRGFGTGITDPGSEKGRKTIAMLGKDWNVNVITLWFTQKGSFSDCDARLDKWMDSVEKSLDTAKSSRVYLILKFGSCWRDVQHGNHGLYYEKPEYADHFVQQWETVAKRFKGRREIYAFELLNETAVRLQPAPGCPDYQALMERTAQAVNRIDPDRTIVVQPEEWWGTRGFEKLKPLKAKNIVYAVHFYAPFFITHQGVDSFLSHETSWMSYRYPGVYQGRTWNRETLRHDLQPVIDFQKSCNAQIIVDEFSCIRWALGDSRYVLLKDMIDLYEKLGWDWTYHAYPEWQGWDPRLGSNPWNQKPPAVPVQTETMLKGWFQKNEKPVF